MVRNCEIKVRKFKNLFNCIKLIVSKLEIIIEKMLGELKTFIQ